jgi:hypothetical protein
MQYLVLSFVTYDHFIQSSFNTFFNQPPKGKYSLGQNDDQQKAAFDKVKPGIHFVKSIN